MEETEGTLQRERNRHLNRENILWTFTEMSDLLLVILFKSNEPPFISQNHLSPLGSLSRMQNALF